MVSNMTKLVLGTTAAVVVAGGVWYVVAQRTAHYNRITEACRLLMVPPDISVSVEGLSDLGHGVCGHTPDSLDPCLLTLAYRRFGEDRIGFTVYLNRTVISVHAPITTTVADTKFLIAHVRDLIYTQLKLIADNGPACIDDKVRKTIGESLVDIVKVNT